MKVHSLHIYPVKSARAIDLQFATVSKYGFSGDREYMVVSPKKSAFITQRQNPRMALLGVKQSASSTKLIYGGDQRDITSVNIIDENQSKVFYKHHGNVKLSGYDCGDDIARFLSDVLREPARLVWQGRDFDRKMDAQFDPNDAKVGYADGFQYLITTLASLSALNHGLLDMDLAILPMNRFRPNIVIDGDFKPFEEDDWAQIQIGGAIIDLIKPCTRCVIPSIHQLTGESSDKAHAVRGLKHIRRHGTIIENNQLGVMFGMLASAQNIDPKMIRTSQEVEILSRHNEPLWQPKKP